MPELMNDPQYQIMKGICVYASINNVTDMKKSKLFIITILVIGILLGLLYVNSRIAFLPPQITMAADGVAVMISDWYNSYKLDGYVLLSTLTDSYLFEELDFYVPSDTYIPTKEEVIQIYSGVYSDSIIASVTNADIIIQDYGVAIDDRTDIMEFGNQIIENLRAIRPDVSFAMGRAIKNGKIEIPVIEYSIEFEEQTTFSFIALVNADGRFVTVTVNSNDDLSGSKDFFRTLIKTMEIK